MAITSSGLSLEKRREEWRGEEYRPRPWFERCVHECGMAREGAMYLGQLVSRMCNLFSAVFAGSRYRASVGRLAVPFHTMAKTVVVAHVPRATIGMCSAIAAIPSLSTSDEAGRRKVLSTASKIVHGVAVWGFASSIFLSAFDKTARAASSLSSAACMASAACAAADLVLSGQDYVRAQHVLSRIDESSETKDVRENLRQTADVRFWKILKCVSAIAVYVLGTGCLALGVAVSSELAIGIAALALASTLFAMKASLCEESMKYKSIDLFGIVQQ